MGVIKDFILLMLFCTELAISAPQVSTTGFVVLSTTETEKEATTIKPMNTEKKLPKIYSMKVDTNVTNRFAKTLVTSKVKNIDDKSQDATFAVVLPETAYISGFVMEIDGKKYEAYVKEKEEAKQIYEHAVASGIAAGHVEAQARDSNRFTVSVNIEPQSKATFYLTYEELLSRQNGAYDIVINLHPGQPVKDLSVEVNINETRPLSFVKAPSLRSGNEVSKNDEKLDPKAQIEHFNKTAAKITFIPDLERQKELGQHLGNKEGTGLAGQFVVQYDVERDPKGGEILISDGYFVHFFAPNDLKPLEKHVVFVLDTSGSMYGTRIEQLKQAMKSILGQLHKEDLFNIIDFNSVVNAWNIPKAEIQYTYSEDNYGYYHMDGVKPTKNTTNETLPEAFQATEGNIKNAEKVIEKLEASGGTDIKSSLVVAMNLLNETQNQRSDTKQPIVIFLTDGEATVGEYGDQAIKSIVTANSAEVPIFSLSFGDGADREFLEKLSLKNQGFARHIYEGADASLQLEEFYKFVSSPLLSKVHFKYVSKSISKLTQTEFPIMFDGSEIVVAGIIDKGFYKSTDDKAEAGKPIMIDNGGLIDPNFAPEVNAWGVAGPIELKPRIENSIGSLEKHWAYLTLNQLLDERDAAENKTQYTKEALEVALKYSFVTPVSSLVVVKPNDTKSEANPEDASRVRPEFDSSAFASVSKVGSVYYMSAPALAQFPGGPIPLSSGYALNHFAEASLSYDSDVVDQGYLLKTSFMTESPVLTTSTAFDSLKSRLPWLNDVLDENETLSLTNGTYKLGSFETISDNPECLSTPTGTAPGNCTLLKDCPQVLGLLTDLKTYETYFCPLNGFAGVCCPKIIPVPESKTIQN